MWVSLSKSQRTEYIVSCKDEIIFSLRAKITLSIQIVLIIFSDAKEFKKLLVILTTDVSKIAFSTKL